MRSILPRSILLLLLITSAIAIEAQSRKRIFQSTNFRIEKLAPRVWAAINNDNYGKAICNAGIIDLGNKTLVFDAFLAPSAANELKIIAKQLTGKPVTLLVNSHYHHDHIRGSQVFLPQASIISTTITRSEIERVEAGEREWGKKYAPTMLEAMRKRSASSTATDREELPFWVGYYEGIIEASDDEFIALPDVLFDDSLWIKGSKLSVKLVERKNGHTASDAVLLIPTLGIAFMGDLLCNGRHPWLSDGDTKAWRESLKTFYEDSVYTKYLPGYGNICGKDELKILYDYLRDIQSMCDSAKTNAAQDALMARPIPIQYRDWHCARFYQPNLQYLIGTTHTKAQDDSKVFGTP